MRDLAALFAVLLALGCASPAERLDEARRDAMIALAESRCDLDETIEKRPAVQAACNDVRNACFDGPTFELRATAEGCDGAVETLRSVSGS